MLACHKAGLFKKCQFGVCKRNETIMDGKNLFVWADFYVLFCLSVAADYGNILENTNWQVNRLASFCV